MLYVAHIWPAQTTILDTLQMCAKVLRDNKQTMVTQPSPAVSRMSVRVISRSIRIKVHVCDTYPVGHLVQAVRTYVRPNSRPVTKHKTLTQSEITLTSQDLNQPVRPGTCTLQTGHLATKTQIT